MRDFASLFRGRDDAYGHYFSLAGKSATERGKITSKAETVQKPVTPALYEAHLAGKERLGIIPVRPDGKCFWFCIDLDFYRIGKKKLADVGGYEKICARIEEIGSKLVVTRSKSGGAHIWALLEEPMNYLAAHDAAVRLADRLNFAAILGLDPKEVKSHTDIFPTNSPTAAEDIGKWVNIPYFGDTCKCVGHEGTADLSIEEFVAYANDRLIHPDDLLVPGKETAPKPVAGRDQWPPCIVHMLENGVPEGHRNDAVTQFGVFALRAFPDEWQEKLWEFNEEACQPPLRKDEVNPIIKSLGGQPYQYLCTRIKDIFCDKEACKKRAFGVGKDTIPQEGFIDKIEKIDGEEPVYLVTIGTKTFQVNKDQLFSYFVFRKSAMAAINRILPNMKQPAWEDMLQEALMRMEITAAAVDTQMQDRVVNMFKGWLSQTVNLESLDEALKGRAAYYDGKRFLFNGDSFLASLDRQLNITRDRAYVYLRTFGVVMMKENGHDLWCYPASTGLWFEPEKKRQL